MASCSSERVPAKGEVIFFFSSSRLRTSSFRLLSSLAMVRKRIYIQSILSLQWTFTTHIAH